MTDIATLLGLFIVVYVIRWAWGSSTTTITINNSSDKPRNIVCCL